MTFQDVVLECCKTPELIIEFDRLQGSNLSRVLIPQPDTRKPIEKMIDDATGYKEVLDQQAHEDMQKFIKFVYDCVWLPLCYSVKSDLTNDN